MSLVDKMRGCFIWFHQFSLRWGYDYHLRVEQKVVLVDGKFSWDRRTGWMGIHPVQMQQWELFTWEWNAWDHDGRVSYILEDDISWMMMYGGESSGNQQDQELRDQGAQMDSLYECWCLQ